MWIPDVTETKQFVLLLVAMLAALQKFFDWRRVRSHREIQEELGHISATVNSNLEAQTKKVEESIRELAIARADLATARLEIEALVKVMKSLSSSKLEDKNGPKEPPEGGLG